MLRTKRDVNNQTLDKRLWEAADQFRANSGARGRPILTPILGLVFLRRAVNVFDPPVGSRMRRVQVPHEAVLRPLTPHALYPLIDHFVAMTPGAELLQNALVGTAVGKVMENAMFWTKDNFTAGGRRFVSPRAEFSHRIVIYS
ncbi:MAG TPA: hypothetical protein VK934_03300 [Fimbriimonas sp.]|nr:hypothetical protein [Fimbriimonas sp.]